MVYGFTSVVLLLNLRAWWLKFDTLTLMHVQGCNTYSCDKQHSQYNDFCHWDYLYRYDVQVAPPDVVRRLLWTSIDFKKEKSENELQQREVVLNS